MLIADFEAKALQFFIGAGRANGGGVQYAVKISYEPSLTAVSSLDASEMWPAELVEFLEGHVQFFIQRQSVHFEEVEYHAENAVGLPLSIIGESLKIDRNVVNLKKIFICHGIS